MKELGNGSYVQPLNTITKSQAQVEVNKENSQAITLGDDSSKVGGNTGLGLANKMKGESNAIENTSSEQQIDAAEGKETNRITLDAAKLNYINQNGGYDVVNKEIARLETNNAVGKVEASKTQTDNEQQNASYMQQLKSVSEGNSDFKSIMEIAQSSGKSMNQVLDDINDYKKTLENTKDNTATTNTENVKNAGIGQGRIIASENNALSEKLNEGQLEQKALDANAVTNLEKDLTAPGVLREQAKNAGMSVPEYLSTQGQSITYNTPNGEKITAMFTKDGEFVSQVREFTNKDGKLEEHRIINENGEFETVKSTLDGSTLVTKKHVEDYLSSYMAGYQEKVESGTQGGSALERTLGEKVSKLSIEEQKNFTDDVLMIEKLKELNGELPKGWSALGKAGTLAVKEIMADYYLAKSGQDGSIMSPEMAKSFENNMKEVKEKVEKLLK